MRVTKTQAICLDADRGITSRFPVDVPENGAIGERACTYGWSTMRYYVATPKLEAEYAHAQAAEKARKIQFETLTTEQLIRITDIANEQKEPV